MEADGEDGAEEEFRAIFDDTRARRRMMCEAAADGRWDLMDQIPCRFVYQRQEELHMDRASGVPLVADKQSKGEDEASLCVSSMWCARSRFPSQCTCQNWGSDLCESEV